MGKHYKPDTKKGLSKRLSRRSWRHSNKKQTAIDVEEGKTMSDFQIRQEALSDIHDRETLLEYLNDQIF